MKTEHALAVLADYALGAESNALNFAGSLIHAPFVTVSDLEKAAWFFSEAARLRREYSLEVNEFRRTG